MDTHYQEIQHQSIMNVLVEKEEMNLFATLNPKISKDGDRWCVLLGEDVITGVCGFGDTPYKAILDFNRSFHKNAQ